MSRSFCAYKKYLLALCVSVTFCYVSCNEKKESTTQKQLDTSILKEYDVEFLNSTVWLPPNYEKLTYEAIFELAKVSDDRFVNTLLQSSKEYRDKEEKPVFFRDELMPSNFIAIYPRPYLALTKEAASYYISDFAATMKREDQQYGRTSEIIEKRIKNFRGHKMVKLKVKQEFAFKNNHHFMQYFISSDIRSFMIIHIDVLNNDYELNFKELSLKSN